MAANRQFALQDREHVRPRQWRGALLAAPAADFKIISRLDEFHALEREWTALYERAGRSRHVFQSFNWLWHWANHFLASKEREGGRLAICTARLDGKLVLVWPTFLEMSGPLSRLVWMGSPVSEFGDVLLDDVPDKQHLLLQSFDFIKARSGADLLLLKKVAADASVAEFLAGVRCTKTTDCEASYIDAKAVQSCRDVPALYSRRSSRMQARKRKRFMNDGGREMERVSEGPRAAQLARLALSQKKLAAGTAAFTDRLAAFVEDVARGETKPVGCEVSFLPAKAGPAAIALGFQGKGGYLSYLVSFEEGCRKYSVGSLLMEDLLHRVCIDAGCNFEHLAGDSIFKRRWSNWAMPVYEFEQAATMLGRVYLMLRGSVIHHVARRTFQGTAAPSA